MPPGVSGLEICRRMRTRDNTRDMPIIMLTARCEENERVRGLSVGADDYVVKPFSTPELMLRVHALLRRARPERVATTLTLGDIDLDRVNRRVKRAGREIHLGPTEFRKLEYLMEKPGRVFTRAQHRWSADAEPHHRLYRAIADSDANYQSFASLVEDAVMGPTKRRKGVSTTTRGANPTSSSRGPMKTRWKRGAIVSGTLMSQHGFSHVTNF